MIPSPTIERGRVPPSFRIRELSGELAAAAGRVHSGWEQGPDGIDVEFGTGGICQDVASAMLDVLAAAGFEQACTIHGTIGENHVWVVALCSDGVYAVDIPPTVYEMGSGFVWRKRHDAVISAGDVTIERIGDAIDRDAFEFEYSQCWG